MSVQCSIIKTPDFVYLVAPFDVYVTASLMRLGSYSPDELATWLPYIPAGGTVIEVGANIGAFTLPLAKHVGPKGHVLAIEPQRDLAYMLCGSLILNDLHNVEVWNGACGADCSETRLAAIDYGSVNNFGGYQLSQLQDRNGATIAVDLLDNVAANCDPCFLKIDVEGMELEVLDGGVVVIEEARPVICVEANVEEKNQALIDWLQARDYRVWWQRPPLGPLWPGVVSQNLLALPAEKKLLPEPQGYCITVEKWADYIRTLKA